MLSVKPWRAEALLFFGAVQLLSVCLGVMVTLLLQKLGVPGFKDEYDFGFILLSTLSMQGVACVLIGFFLHYHGVSWLDELGFRKKRWLRSLLLMLGVVIFIMPVSHLLQALSISLMEKIHWAPQTEEAVDLVTNATAMWTQIYLAFFAIVLAPVAEEFVFRGVLYPYFNQRGFHKLAWIGVNLVFAFIHGNAADFIPLFVLALALTWLYETTDNLLMPIFAHAAFNAANLVLLKYAMQ